MSQDIIDHFVGTPLALRDRRPITKEQTQASYQALFVKETANFSRLERFAIAQFVAGLHRDKIAQDFYANQFREHDEELTRIIAKAAAASLTHGPYGLYPEGPLSPENREGSQWQGDENLRDKVGHKLTAALEHAHFLIFHPRDASKDRLEYLIGAGWDTPAIVTLSQLIAYLCYQLRIAHGLRILEQFSDKNRSHLNLT